MSEREHVPAPPQTIGQSVGLVYCKACGYLLATPEGPRARAEQPCVPVRVELR